MIGSFKNYRQEINNNKGKKIVSFPVRFFFRWKKALQPGSSSVKDESPWLTFHVIDFIKNNLKPNHKVFEFGGGGSTLFFLKHAGQIVTVEHDGEWFKILENIVAEKKYKNWTRFFKGPVKGDVVSSPDYAEPEHYVSFDKPFNGYNFKDYASAIDQYNDNMFDWVLVDGRARPSCIKHGIPKVKKGGYLIVDNANRDYYLQETNKLINESFKLIIDSYGPSPYNGEFSVTAVWKKIK